MLKRVLSWSTLLCLALFLVPGAWAQNTTATLSGTLSDPQGAVIPGVELTLTSVETSAVRRTTSNDSGLYTFANMIPGVYELKVSLAGFKDLVQTGIALEMNEVARLDVEMQIGVATETIEVVGDASPINFDTAEVKGGISRDILNELPLQVAGTVRSSATFAILMPGVTTGGTGDPFGARINGGLQTGDEAIMDGVSMQQGMMNQTGMISILSDFPMTPDMVQEMSVLTSTYDASYGTSTSGQIVLETKSGTDEFHFSAFEFHRNSGLNARPYGASERPKDVEHDFGANLGGPVKVPGFWSGNKRTYFYVNLEGFRNAGGVNRNVISIPTAQQRIGDFSDWRDASDNIIPIYDPATTAVNPLFQDDPGLPLFDPRPFLRQQFMGCGGADENVICATDPRLVNSLASGWLNFLPATTLPGTTNNFEAPPIPDVLLATSNYSLVRVDQYIGEKDHIAVSVWYQGGHPNFDTSLPVEIASEQLTRPQFSFVDRLRWNHTFGPRIVNQFAFGYLNRNEGYGGIQTALAPNAVPRVPGVSNPECPPVIGLSEFSTLGNSACLSDNNETDRQTYIFLDTLMWTKGKHMFKFGFEYRDLAQNIRNRINNGGTFGFSRASTGLLGVNSGNSVASFLLEAVDNADVNVQSINAWYPRSDFFIAHFSDTFKVNSKLSLTYGLRWDMMTPARELFNHFSFFDPLGANPGAGGRPGRLVFAGTEDLATGDAYPADAAFGARFPEKTWKNGFAPRFGFAYGLSKNMVIRGGYGVFFTQAFYPGWESSISTEGFNSNFSVSSTLGGIEPAFLLSDGFPIGNFTPPPFIDPSFRNGQGIFNRPSDANRRGYAQQWNLTIERQLTENLSITGAYVGNKGTRLVSVNAPPNVLDPALLSTFGGAGLNAEFDATEADVNGVSVPYAGWVNQLGDCAPSVAQALLPFPQYCGSVQGINENAGSSIYHSFQFKAERRFAKGTFLLASYTLQKGITTGTDHTQSDALTWSGASGVISPFERNRNRALFVDDVPQTLSVAWVQELPFGRGRTFLNSGGALNKLLGGWTISNVFRASSGIPFFFRSGNCNVPGQFRTGCIPSVLPGADPFAQSKDNFDPNQPLFNVNSFTPVSAFDDLTFYGDGPRVSNIRGFAFQNHDFSLKKRVPIKEGLVFIITAEFFNIWNWHKFSASGQFGDNAFNTNIASTNFGLWNGTVTNPRNIQVGGRIRW